MSEALSEAMPEGLDAAIAISQAISKLSDYYPAGSRKESGNASRTRLRYTWRYSLWT
ncbi:hypothetical protein JYQ62_23205 [Nostoc sp. UHCC 0702]|nr:hypothetical protein JYQ62_23205 [Nostoc sp. UHCC 0702]